MRPTLESEQSEGVGSTLTMNFPYTAKPVRRLTPTGAMMVITATVGASSVLLFLVCVIYSQDPWPAALASFSLAGMATGFGYFISQRRPL